MKETPKHHIRYPDGTDLVRNASAQFKDMAQSIDNNIDDLPDTILVKVKDATARTEKAAADAEKYSGGAVAMQDGAVAGLLGELPVPRAQHCPTLAMRPAVTRCSSATASPRAI